MPNFNPQQLKRALVDAGFIIFRTLPDTFYEVTLGKEAAGLDEALDSVRFAFALDRVAR
jgi:hypothetical protein